MPTTILLVDDDAVVRRSLERTINSDARLQKLALRFVHAADGKKGLAQVAAERPDLIITDLFMPGMDGFAFCRALRGTPEGLSVPVIVTSGVYKEPDLVRGLVDEFKVMFLPKPVAGDDLGAAILSMVDRQRAPAAEAVFAPLAEGAATTSDGLLADRGVPRLLLDHIEARSTGTLVLVRGKMGKELFLRDGRTVGAESNLRQEALGSLLLARGVIDEQQLAYLLAESKARNQKMGTVLVELGWLTPEDVLQFLAGQARKRIVDCLRWNDGSYSFDPGDAFADRVIEHDLDIEGLIFKGLQRTAAPDTLVGRFDEDGARPLKLAPRFARFAPSFNAVFGSNLAELLAGGPRAGTILGSLILRPDSELLLLGIEALLLTGLAELGAPAPEAAQREHPDASESFSLERLGAEVSGAFKRITLAPVDDLFTDATVSLPTSAIRPPDPGVVPAPLGDGEESGVVSFTELPVAPAMPARARKPPPPIRRPQSGDLRRDLLIEYLEIHGKTPHEVLGLVESASGAEISAAFTEKMNQFSLDAYAQVDLAEDTPKLQAVRSAYQRAHKALSGPPQVAQVHETGYDPSEQTDPLGAELAFGTGLGLLSSGEHQQAVAQFDAATKARPDQAAYHAYLGWTLFVARGDVSVDEAREKLLHALTLDPDLSEAHEFLGRVALSQGDDEEARLHFERTLELDPAQPEAVELLVRLYARTGDLRATERLYRRAIAGLGERALPLRRRLWKELADLYEAELGDRGSARIAYEMAARLAPDDLAIQRKVVELNAEDPARWREICRALTAEWRLRPDDRQVGAALMDLLTRAGRHDAATVAAAALALRGLSDDETRQIADQNRPRLLPRLPPLPPTTLGRLGYSAEDADLEQLFNLLAQAEIVRPFSGDDLGFGTETPLSFDRLSDPFRRVLQYVCRTLNTPPPAIFFRHGDLVSDARLADVRPYALLVGPALLESSDTVELGFRLGRAMALATPGRIAGSSRSGRQLRPYLLAALALGRGDDTPEALEVEAICRRIASGDATLLAQVVEFGLRILHERPAINLSAWSRTLNRTATRMGLLICGDLLRVGRAVAEEEGPEALDHLLEFALSLEHFDLRDELGVSAVV